MYKQKNKKWGKKITINELGYGIDINHINLRPKNAPNVILKKINLLGTVSWFTILTNVKIYESDNVCLKIEGFFNIEKINLQPIILTKATNVTKYTKILDVKTLQII